MAPRHFHPSVAPILTLLWATTIRAYFADFSVLGGRPHEPTCVDIPRNMSLCSDIGYSKMRLPNLLDHDTLTEVQQQSGSWVPLLNVQCHPHTKLFLCSLFTPVCLESQIFPCRSLCNAVQRGCESRMRTYGYHWPDMLLCSRFPEDNDMCIKAADAPPSDPSSCSACNPVDTFENILDNFCRAETVVRARLKRQTGKKIILRKTKLFKSDGVSKKTKQREKMVLVDTGDCCKLAPGKQKYLIMGIRVNDNSISPTFILPWKKSKSMRQAVRMFKNLDCNDPDLFTSSSDDGMILPKIKPTDEVKLKKKGRKRGRKNGRKANSTGGHIDRRQNMKNRERNGKYNKKNRNNEGKKTERRKEIDEV